jgi:hypothetical protein
MRCYKWIRGLLLGVIIIGISNLDANAQYATALGVRLGGTSGFTIKHKYSSTMAFEGIVGVFQNGLSVTGLIERQQSLNVEGLYLYYGGGLHMAFYNGSHYSRFGRDVTDTDSDGVGFGLNGIVGLEYRLPENIPFALSFDLKPFLEVGTDNYVGFAPDPAISIRFIIK